ncbi:MULTISPECIES: nuclear transport factor 2 family protein [unclassified Pseudomonas]|uniref:nuclear transport factor 2 family protein n=1 Tax=unclassified Pseudomonas TaxID=196821 RepID=UPI0015AA6EAD|nr:MULTISPECIES: nuclear transport factor 2 family protein [unclassified Pseudomonas]
MDIRLEILAFEQLLLEPETRKNDRLLEQLLAEEFVEFGAVGKSWTKAEVIAGLKSQIFIKRTIEDFKLCVLADSVALAYAVIKMLMAMSLYHCVAPFGKPTKMVGTWCFTKARGSPTRCRYQRQCT